MSLQSSGNGTLVERGSLPMVAIDKRFPLYVLALLAAILLATGINATQATAASVTTSWVGPTVWLNRNDTNNVMFGTAGAAIAASRVPVYGWAVAGALGLYTGYANWAYNRGACLKFTASWASLQLWWPNHYYGGRCY